LKKNKNKRKEMVKRQVMKGRKAKQILKIKQKISKNRRRVVQVSRKVVEKTNVSRIRRKILTLRVY